MLLRFIHNTVKNSGQRLDNVNPSSTGLWQAIVPPKILMQLGPNSLALSLEDTVPTIMLEHHGRPLPVQWDCHEGEDGDVDAEDLHEGAELAHELRKVPALKQSRVELNKKASKSVIRCSSASPMLDLKNLIHLASTQLLICFQRHLQLAKFLGMEGALSFPIFSICLYFWEIWTTPL